MRIAPAFNTLHSSQAQSSSASARSIDTIRATVSSSQGQTADLSARQLISRRYIATQVRDRWQPGTPLEGELGLSWSNGEAFDAQRVLGITTANALQISLALAWRSSAELEAERTVRRVETAHHLSLDSRLPWRTPAHRDAQNSAAWQPAQRFDSSTVGLPFRNPDAHDVQRSDHWHLASARDHQVWFGAGKAQDRDTHRLLPWRRADAARWVFLIEQPKPPVIVEPVPHCYQPPARGGVFFKLVTGTRDTPLDRHALAFSLSCQRGRVFDLRSTLSMSHTLSVVRLPDRLALAVTRVSLAADRDSWGWTMQLNFADAASLIAVEPTTSSTVSIEITVDGHVWVGEVEGYTEERRLNVRRGSVTARSRTVQLAAPQAPERSYTNANATTAQQLAASELTFTGFELDWRIPDWPLPACVYSTDRTTPLATVIAVATAAGAMVQSAPAADTLIVAHRYPDAPWALASAAPDFALGGGSWFSTGKRWVPGPAYNGVYVSGRDQGVLARVYREGTSGSPYAPMVIDPLVTDSTPARGRGIEVIANSLPRHEIPIELPLRGPGQPPGLLLPGELGELVDTVWGSYRAVVDSVEISAEVSAEGLLTARQRVNLWRTLT